MKILLADDDPKIHAVMRLWLSRNDCELETALNGREALAKLQSSRFDGLITDINMPLMNGVELIRAAQRLPGPPRLTIILTSRCDTAQLQEQLNASNVEFLSKPFSPAALVGLIEKLKMHPAAPE